VYVFSDILYENWASCNKILATSVDFMYRCERNSVKLFNYELVDILPLV